MPLSYQKIIGITGNIGAGKSLVSKIIKELGYRVYNSDSRAKYLTNHCKDIKFKIISLFGKESYQNKKYNAPFISQRVFGDKKKLQELNNIVHPVVKKDFNNWKKKNSSENFLFKEAAILIESGSHKQLDHLLLIKAPKKERIKRIKKRDNSSEEEILEKMKMQLSEDEKIKFCDYQITNTKTELLVPKVLSFLKSIEKI